MSENNHKTLCAYVEEETQVKDPKTYIALISAATHYCKGCGRSVAKAKMYVNPKNWGNSNFS